MVWAGEQYEIDFLKKSWFGDGSCFQKKNNTLPERGWGWEIALLQTSEKSAKTKMTLIEFKPTFRSILELFLKFRGSFEKMGGGV